MASAPHTPALSVMDQGVTQPASSVWCSPSCSWTSNPRSPGTRHTHTHTDPSAGSKACPNCTLLAEMPFIWLYFGSVCGYFTVPLASKILLNYEDSCQYLGNHVPVVNRGQCSVILSFWNKQHCWVLDASSSKWHVRQLNGRKTAASCQPCQADCAAVSTTIAKQLPLPFTEKANHQLQGFLLYLHYIYISLCYA